MDNKNYLKENWNQIKETVRNEYDLSDISYNTWVKPLTFNNIKDDNNMGSKIVDSFASINGVTSSSLVSYQNDFGD